MTMSEMLGNYHFLIRDYYSALEELENHIKYNPHDKRAKKKLIICYTQTGNLNKSLELFIDLIEEDIYCIINTNPETEDCPCPDLVNKLEKEGSNNLGQYWLNIELGILWLYCDKEKSLSYFEKAYQIDNSDLRIISIIQKIKSVDN